MKSGIYKIKCIPSNKVYVGQSINVDSRLNTHLNDLKNNNHCNTEMQNDFNTYGAVNFEFKVIASCEPEVLNCLEKYYIQKYCDLNRSYNMKAGGAKNREEILLTIDEYKKIEEFKSINKIHISQLEPILLLAQNIFESGLYTYGKYKELSASEESFLIKKTGVFNEEYMKRVLSLTFTIMKLVIKRNLDEKFEEIDNIIKWRVSYKTSDFSKRFIILKCEVIKTGEEFDNHIFF